MITRLLVVAATTSFVLAVTNAYQFDSVEAFTQADFETTKIDVRVCVKDDTSGDAVPSPTLTLVNWSAGTENEIPGPAPSNEGCFDLTTVSRSAVRIAIDAKNYYSSIISVDLHIPTSVASVDLEDILMTKKRDGVARIIFGGDVMFERRFFDAGLLHLDENLEEETAALFRYIQPFLAAGDHTNVNLECPIVDDRSTPHPSKNIVFGCHRDTAYALPQVGIDSVTVANNHLYDYLEIGTSDTMRILDDVGMPWFGGGMTRSEARNSLQQFDLSGTGVDPLLVSLQGFTNFFDYAKGDAYTTFADYSPIVKGGAMPAFTTELRNFVQGEVQAGRIAVPVIHGGTEYKLTQSSGMRKDFETSALAGASLVIAHHPHVIHGISTFRPGPQADPIFVVGSLGNLVFDQDIHETFPGYLAVVDMEKTGKVTRLELVPYVVERYVPRPVTTQNGIELASSALERATRRIAHMSTNEALRGEQASTDCIPNEATSPWVKHKGCGFGGAVPFLENGKILVVASEEEVNRLDKTSVHELRLSSSSDDRQIIAVHEHHTDASSSLASMEAVAESKWTTTSMNCELGVDLLRVGGFETETAGEYGVKDYPTSSLWRVSNHRKIQSSVTRTGSCAAVLLRTSTNNGRTSLYYDRRVDVVPGSKVTVRGFHRLENAGKFVAAVYVIDSNGDTRYETGMSYTHAGGSTNDWEEFNVNLDIPLDVVEIKAYFRQYPPEQGGEGRVFLDDISFIQWDADSVSLSIDGASTSSPSVDLVTPNGWEYVRCTPNGSDDMTLELHITGRTYESKINQVLVSQKRNLRNNR